MRDNKATPKEELLDRRNVVRCLVEGRGDSIMIGSLGAPTYDLGAAADHERNFYLWGAMGGAAMVGLGLALAQPKVPVVTLSGDGETLMGLGSFATIAVQRPGNFSVVILDNELYGETGSQRSHTAWCTDLAAVAKACGIADTRVVRQKGDLAALARDIHTVRDAPLVAVVKIDGEEKTRFLPSRDGVLLKGRLRAALGFESM